jgi:Right handed beta helix region
MSIVVSPDGLDQNEGTAASPWPLATGLEALDNGEDVLYLRGGTYVGRVLIQNLTGTAVRPKVICSYPGEHAVIDGTLEDFRDAPNDLWEAAAGTNSDEYISKNWYEHGNDAAARGSFLERVPHTRLITHQFLQDLQSENERCERLPVGQTVDGPEPAADAPNRRPWVYMGPGIFQDDQGFIHVRLSPTHNNVAGFPDYDGETDPRKVPLAIWTSSQGTLRIVGCIAVHVCDITVRHGDKSVVIDTCTGVRLDHVNVFAGNEGIRLSGSCAGTAITHCLVDGGLPPWHFRSDRKDEFKLASDTGGRAHAPGENTMKTLLAGNPQCQGTTVSFCELVNGHDNFLFGKDVEFSGNWVKNMNDDAIVIDTENSANHRIFGNVIEQCQTAISSGGASAAGAGTLVYRNLIDLRRPFAKSRPQPAGTVTDDGTPSADPESDEGAVLATGNLYKSNRPDGPLAIFQNTIVVKDRTIVSSFGFFRNYQEGDAERSTYNNIFVAVNTVPGSDVPIGFLPDPNLPGETNGNLYYRAGQYIDGFLLRHRAYAGRPAGSFSSLAELRGDAPFGKSPIFADSELMHPPGYEKDGLDTDPRFRDFHPTQTAPAGADDMRLACDSRALHAGVVLPESLRTADGAPPGERPDIGFVPYGSPPLAVGVDARRRFPHTTPPPAVPG